MTDADGNEICDVIWADLKTGKCIVHVRDVQGSLILNGDAILTEVRSYPTPLHFERLSD